MTDVESIRYTNVNGEARLSILDQLLLPQRVVYLDIKTIQDGWNAIKNMNVRGAPAIAIVGVLSLVVEMNKRSFGKVTEFFNYIHSSLDYLITARPTAVNIFRAANDIRHKLSAMSSSTSDSVVGEVMGELTAYIEKMMHDDVKDNMAIGEQGAYDIINRVCSNNTEDDIVLLTHCNTGSLATVGYGTALGVVRSLHKRNKLKHVYCTETRPYNQGARLTAFELVAEGIPSTLICDSAVSVAMQHKRINAVIVGADRVAINGDTANKIGTYQIAVAAKHHGIPFYTAVPSTTIDKNIKCGEDIVIEERDHKEITHFRGEVVAADGIGCWNPAFDVTPASLMTGGIITEFGVFKPEQLWENVEKFIRQ